MVSFAVFSTVEQPLGHNALGAECDPCREAPLSPFVIPIDSMLSMNTNSRFDTLRALLDS